METNTPHGITQVIRNLSPWHIQIGDCLEVLKFFPDKSVQCGVTSPPYYDLRDYQKDGQIGMEDTPEAYVARLVEVFTEFFRVLRDDGTLWLNLGDTYWNSKDTTIKQKDLIGIPWMVALALRSAGWYLRADIIWGKSNPMPESVRDRPTKAHEYLFLLTKKPNYFYDSDAIMEYQVDGKKKRNKRSVWLLPTKPFSAKKLGFTDTDHFAVMPPDLVEPCILAGTSEKGCCPHCGTPWTREVVSTGGRDWRQDVMIAKGIPGELAGNGSYKRGQSKSPLNNTKTRTTIGWKTGCNCPKHEPIPCLVLDNFNGAATTGVVALKLGRRYLGIELNADYVAISEARIKYELNRLRIHQETQMEFVPKGAD